MSRDGNLPVILGGLLASVIGVVSLLAWGKSRAAESPPSNVPPLDPKLVPIVLFPDIKPGDTLIVDAARANIPNAPAPLLVCTVDLVMTDRALVSVRAVATSFAGTIPRTSIVRVLPPPPPGVFT